MLQQQVHAGSLKEQIKKDMLEKPLKLAISELAAIHLHLPEVYFYIHKTVQKNKEKTYYNL